MVDLGAYRDKFGDSGQRVLENALGESQRRDQNYITVEHIIHALAKEEPDLFNTTIRSLSIDPAE
ncbi:MAG TPA: Clp protease N-terminal domain-containing protein, partial [Pyrinomonadaceae bacterium]